MKKKPIETTIKRILAIFIVIVISFSILPLHSSFSQNIDLPTGWSFSENYQKVPVTLRGITYYAYEIEKKEDNGWSRGWFVVNSYNKTISNRGSYEKLALAATVTKYTQKFNELNQMENEVKMLSQIKWKLVFYESTMPFLKSLASSIGTIISGKIPSGLIEETAGSIVAIPQIFTIELSNKFVKEYTEWVGNNVAETLIDSGELINDASEIAILKVFGVIKVVMRKGALITFKKGHDEFKQALNILKSHSGAWSYEDASEFLSKYEEGKSMALPYASWYLRLIPSSVWEGLWDNVFKQVIPDLLSEPADIAIKLPKWFNELVERGDPQLFGYNQVIDDIESISSGFTLYKWFYDTSMKDSMASKTYNDIVANLKGTLSVTSNPTGANVYINGEYEGIAPIDIVLTPGNYSVKLTKEGYLDYYSSITVSQKETTKLPVTLKFLTNEEEPKKWVLILAKSLAVLDGPNPTGKAIVGNYGKEGVWTLLTLVHSGELLEYVDESYHTIYSLMESFPQCLKAFKVKTKDGKIGWVIASWSGGLLEDEVELAKVVTEKTSYSVNPVTFGDVSGEWTGYYEKWVGMHKEQVEFRINISQSDSILFFSGTSSEILNGETKTTNIGGSLFKDKIYFIKYYPDGNWTRYQGTVSQDGKSAEGNLPTKWFIWFISRGD